MARTDRPGSAIGIALMQGDISAYAIGTLSYRDGDHILAFGHPFTDLPGRVGKIKVHHVERMEKLRDPSHVHSLTEAHAATTAAASAPGVAGVESHLVVTP